MVIDIVPYSMPLVLCHFRAMECSLPMILRPKLFARSPTHRCWEFLLKWKEHHDRWIYSRYECSRAERGRMIGWAIPWIRDFGRRGSSSTTQRAAFTWSDVGSNKCNFVIFPWANVSCHWSSDLANKIFWEKKIVFVCCKNRHLFVSSSSLRSTHLDIGNIKVEFVIRLVHDFFQNSFRCCTSNVHCSYVTCIFSTRFRSQQNAAQADYHDLRLISVTIDANKIII